MHRFIIMSNSYELIKSIYDIFKYNKEIIVDHMCDNCNYDREHAEFLVSELIIEKENSKDEI